MKLFKRKFMRTILNTVPTNVRLIIVGLLMLLQACNDQGTLNDTQPCFPIDIVPHPSYDSPVWHPSGNFIGFNHIPLKEIEYPRGIHCQGVLKVDFDSSGFWLINPDGSNMRRIFPYTLLAPAWSPDGQWIAFVAGTQIFKMRFTGTAFDTTTLTQLTFEGRNFFPAWSPDGQWIIHDRTYAYPESSSVQGIWLLSTDGNNRYKISTGRYPRWSPNGQHIIFVDWFDNVTGGIVRYDRQTATRTLLLDGRGADIRQPKYSPNGNKIAFWSNSNLWLMDTSGSNQHQLTTQGIDVSFGLPFSWSPDGTRIVYAVYRSNDWGYENGVLWTLNLNTGEKKQLTFNRKPSM